MLRLAEEDGESSRYRPTEFSEKQFVDQYLRLPEQEREFMRLSLARRCEDLHKIAREIDRRAKAALAAGDYGTAERFYNCLRRVGTANVGPESEVTKIGNMTGRSMAARAVAGLSEIAVAKGAGTTAPTSNHSTIPRARPAGR